MKLSSKIYIGFGVMLSITLILTGTSLFIMKGVVGKARMLSDLYMPETRIASQIERGASRAVSAISAYDTAHDESFLNASRKYLDQVRKGLQDASRLTAAYPELNVLKNNTDIASSRLKEYEALVGDTEKTGLEIRDIRKKLDSAAQEFMKPCLEFVENQTEKLTADMNSPGADPASMHILIENINAMNDVIQLGYVIQMDTLLGQLVRNPSIIEESAKKFVEMENSLHTIEKKATSDSSVSELEDIRLAASSYKTNMKKLTAHYTTLTELGKMRSKIGESLSSSAETTAVAGIDETVKNAAAVVQVLSVSGTRMIFGGIIGMAISILFLYFITRSICRPITRIISGLNEGASQVSLASGEVASSSQALAEGVSEQAAAIEEISSSLEQMSSMTRQNAGNANQANGIMDKAGQLVATANTSMAELTVSMKEISLASEETSKIIKTIDEIAFQTNLLALNAAVEAARAGEAGAGFAVVADEVRNLAMRASAAARSTSTLIEETGHKVKNGTLLVARTDEAFSEVTRSTAVVGKLISEIAAASAEQSLGIDQISSAVVEMDKVVQQNAGGAEESSSMAEEMNAQAEEMKDMVNELLAMVAGKAALGPGAATDSIDPVKSVSALTGLFLVSPHPKNEPAITGGREISPNDVIPLDETDS